MHARDTRWGFLQEPVRAFVGLVTPPHASLLPRALLHLVQSERFLYSHLVLEVVHVRDINEHGCHAIVQLSWRWNHGDNAISGGPPGAPVPAPAPAPAAAADSAISDATAPAIPAAMRLRLLLLLLLLLTFAEFDVPTAAADDGDEDLLILLPPDSGPAVPDDFWNV
ncbi:unnamed protein product [Closterium sp. NIES-54]